MTISTSNYLDFGNLLVNELIGDVGLFSILLLILITYTALKFRLPAEVTIVLILIGTAVIVSYAFNAFLWMIVLLVFGVIIYAFLPKILRR
jgi:hypothetical protein